MTKRHKLPLRAAPVSLCLPIGGTPPLSQSAQLRSHFGPIPPTSSRLAQTSSNSQPLSLSPNLKQSPSAAARWRPQISSRKCECYLGRGLCSLSAKELVFRHEGGRRVLHNCFEKSDPLCPSLRPARVHAHCTLHTVCTARRTQSLVLHVCCGNFSTARTLGQN